MKAAEEQRFMEELAADEAFERRLFVREIVIVVAISALIAARIIFV